MSDEEFGGPVWAFRVRYPAEIAQMLGLYQLDITCRHGSADATVTPTSVDMLTATQAVADAGWRVEIADSSYVVEDDDHDVPVTPQTWDFGSPELIAITTDVDGAAAQPKHRRRFRFICPECGNDVPARAEHLDTLVTKLAPTDVRSIELDTLRHMLSLVT